MSARCDAPVPDLAHELPNVSADPCSQPLGHELPHKNATGVTWTDDYVGYLRVTREKRPLMDIVLAPDWVSAYLTRVGYIER